jgi:succinate dehydrogenase/fumarate reductase flavoprotein subunit
MLPSSSDVVVVGAGNAAFCGALAAAEHGVSVLVLERAPESECGGNSRFTAGAFRCVGRRCVRKDRRHVGRAARRATALIGAESA